MLASYVCQIFRNPYVALRFSENARRRALKIHDKEEIREQLLSIYENILNSEV